MNYALHTSNCRRAQKIWILLGGEMIPVHRTGEMRYMEARRFLRFRIKRADKKAHGAGRPRGLMGRAGFRNDKARQACSAAGLPEKISSGFYQGECAFRRSIECRSKSGPLHDALHDRFLQHEASRLPFGANRPPQSP
jgi:hypothetical protein